MWSNTFDFSQLLLHDYWDVMLRGPTQIAQALSPAFALHNDKTNPVSKVDGANIGPIWGLQDPGGPHVGPMNFAFWEYLKTHVHIHACFTTFQIT